MRARGNLKLFGTSTEYIINALDIFTNSTTKRRKSPGSYTITVSEKNGLMKTWLPSGKNLVMRNYVVCYVFRIEIIILVRLVSAECRKLSLRKARLCSVFIVGVEDVLRVIFNYDHIIAIELD